MLVGRVAWKAADGSQRFGQASSFLTCHAPPGTPISFKLVRVRHYKFAADPEAHSWPLHEGSRPSYAKNKSCLTIKIKLTTVWWTGPWLSPLKSLSNRPMSLITRTCVTSVSFAVRWIRFDVSASLLTSSHQHRLTKACSNVSLGKAV